AEVIACDFDAIFTVKRLLAARRDSFEGDLPVVGKLAGSDENATVFRHQEIDAELLTAERSIAGRTNLDRRRTIAAPGFRIERHRLKDDDGLNARLQFNAAPIMIETRQSLAAGRPGGTAAWCGLDEDIIFAGCHERECRSPFRCFQLAGFEYRHTLFDALGI